MAYYIKFNKDNKLEISRYCDLVDYNYYYPVRLKTLATINAFLKLLNIDDKLYYLKCGYTLKMYIPSNLIDIDHQNKFRDTIRRYRFKCHIENICCSIITRYDGIYYFKDYKSPEVFEYSPVININYFCLEQNEINCAYNNVYNYLNLKNKYLLYYDTEALPDGGFSVLFNFNNDLKIPEKDEQLLNLLGILKQFCVKNYWNCAVEYANFKNSLVLQIFRSQSNLYTQYSGSQRLGLALDRRKKAGIQC